MNQILNNRLLWLVMNLYDRAADGFYQDSGERLFPQWYAELACHLRPAGRELSTCIDSVVRDFGKHVIEVLDLHRKDVDRAERHTKRGGCMDSLPGFRKRLLNYEYISRVPGWAEA